MQVILKDEVETERLAKIVAQHIRVGDLVALEGDLAAGKTTFTRYLVAALGGTVPVSSPSFSLCHEYPCTNGVIIEHWDLYRLSSAPNELEFPPVSQHILLVEWLKRDLELAKYAVLTVEFKLSELGTTFRSVAINGIYSGDIVNRFGAASCGQ